MTKKVISVGVKIPGGKVEYFPPESRASLLDADIVFFRPYVIHGYGDESFQGKTCLSESHSFQSKQAEAHWNSELSNALKAGKLVIVTLDEPLDVYVYTGNKTWSGTGKNARATNNVALYRANSQLPINLKEISASGKQIVLLPNNQFFAPLWQTVGKHFEFKAYLEQPPTIPLLSTRTGGKIVGGLYKVHDGHMLVIPHFDAYKDDFKITEIDEDGDEIEVWSPEAIAFGNALVSESVNISNYLINKSEKTPPPDWVSEDTFRLKRESQIESQITEVTLQITGMEENKTFLEGELEQTKDIKRLLFEQGTPLEDAVLGALRTLGFTASRVEEGNSEFDAVFTSPEGRFLGEVEGKDSKAITIGKFSQLERNIAEDFSRDEVSAHAKAVLFGNAYRLTPIHERPQPFTEKCIQAAQRVKAAMVHTPDLFEVVKYLTENTDPVFAESCRKAIFETEGQVVTFPQIPKQVLIKAA